MSRVVVLRAGPDAQTVIEQAGLSVLAVRGRNRRSRTGLSVAPGPAGFLPSGLRGNAARGVPRRRPRFSDPPRMAFWKKLLGSDDDQRVDYYDEGVTLLEDGKVHEALTSFRLALKAVPGDAVALQQIAICYTKIGMVVEAAKTYRHVLQKDPGAAGAHYGLAFILLRSESAL